MKRNNLFNKKKDMSQNKDQDFPLDENQDDLENFEENSEEDSANEFENNEETSRLEEELQQLKDKYIRLVAEYDNFRKRTAKEKTDLIKVAGEDIVSTLLEVLDDAERAEQQMEKSDDYEGMKSGVNLIFNKLRNNLKNKGLVAMESMDTEFNPELHEAITEIPAGKESQVGQVMDEVQKGYYLNDKIIRHAKVVVGK